jgi:hypothetical protein
VAIQTGWGERQAVRGKGRHGVVQALTTIEQHRPFPLRGIDSDNGSECSNAPLYAFCPRPAGPAIQFTRSRPSMKDDNAHVEQKHWTHVRKLIGWDRYDSPEALAALKTLYADLRLFPNLFPPSMKLQRKERRGSRLIRRYDRPQTPCERVRACPEADPRKLAALRRVLQTTDPFVLSVRLDQQRAQLSRLAHRPSPQPREPRPLPRRRTTRSPWPGWTFSPRIQRPSQAPVRPAVKTPTLTVGPGATITRPAKGTAKGKSGSPGWLRPREDFQMTQRLRLRQEFQMA